MRTKITTTALAGLVAVASAVLAPNTSAQPVSTRMASSSSQASQTSAELSAASMPRPKPISWHACASPSLIAAQASCGFLTVPMDWSNPAGTKIKIAVSRVLHTVPDDAYQGIMITNPGGPGGSGLGLASLGDYVPNGAGDSYDWIGFDPRGVGSSIPSLSCIPNYFAGPRPEYIPRTKALEKVWLTRSHTYANACKKNGPLLEHMKTVDVARDVDYLRAALGQKQINYYGFSYGTYLAQVYSTLFPSRVRRMVLDSTVDPRGVWYQDNLAQDIAFQRTMDIWFGWVAKYDNTYHLGKTAAAVKQAWYHQKAVLTTSPAGAVVGPDEWTDIFLYAGYYQTVWTDLANVFARWVNNHDLVTLEAAYQDYVGPTDDNGFAVYSAVQCTDTQWPRNWSKWRQDNWNVYRKAPFETWGNAWYNAPCIFWPAKAGAPVKIDGGRVKSVLMIDETLDAATPYPGSVYVRDLYPNARLIAEPGGTTHAGTLYGNACVDNKIAAYLATGALPARRRGHLADAICAPLPQPVPDPPTAAGTSSAVAQRHSALTLKIASSRGLPVGR